MHMNGAGRYPRFRDGDSKRESILRPYHQLRNYTYHLLPPLAQSNQRIGKTRTQLNCPLRW